MRRARGAALVLALVLALVASAIAVGTIWTQRLWQRQAELSTSETQARALALSGVQWARYVLFEDARRGRVDHLGELWAVRLPPTPLEGGEVSGYLLDQHAYLNLNDLVRDGLPAEAQVARLRRLLGLVGARPALADTLASALLARGPLTLVRDLLQVPGWGRAEIAAVERHVTALPPGKAPSALNVNTAGPEALAATLEGLSLEQAQALVASRRGAPFRDLGAFRARVATAPAAGPPPELGVSSAHFLAVVEARQGDIRATARALLARDDGDWPVVVWMIVE